MSVRLIAIALMTVMGLGVTAARADTLQTVRENGFLTCGVRGGMPGFSAQADGEAWAGLEIDYCRAMAAAIFNDADAVRYLRLADDERFAALKAEEVDVLSWAVWTMKADTAHGANFAGVLYYDGLGFLVRAGQGIDTVAGLADTELCMQDGAVVDFGISDYFQSNGLSYTAVTFPSTAEAFKSFVDGRCAAFAANLSSIHALVTTTGQPTDFAVLGETVSKQPLGPAVREGDDGWFNIARWVIFALLNAEEFGITTSNVDEMLGSDNPAVQRLLGVEGDYGTALGLDKDWAYNIVKQLGNYGEIYERHIGVGTPVGLERGINALWNAGGVQYAPPIR